MTDRSRPLTGGCTRLHDSADSRVALHRQHSRETLSLPVTPFHFGPGLLIKAAAPRHFSLLSFVATEVVVDVEVVVRIARGSWPIHGELHSLLGSTIVGLAVGLTIHQIGRWVRRRRPRIQARPMLRAELSLPTSIAGGLIGGVSASLLDALMHEDVQPFWPFAAGNPLLGTIGWGALHIACGLAVIVGLGALAYRTRVPGQTA